MNTTDEEDIEVILERSLDDDQESRRCLLESASASQPGRFSEESSGSEVDPDHLAQLVGAWALEKGFISPETVNAFALELGFVSSGEEIVRRVRDAYHRVPGKSRVPTLREHLAALSAENCRAVIASYVSDAGVSCAYEGIRLNVDRMVERIQTETGDRPESINE